MNQKKIVCLHFHIFKNGGTTLEWILNQNFGSNAISKDTDDPKGILENKIILDILKKNEKIKAISSHQLRFPLPEKEGVLFIPIVFFRHPIDRAFSIYSFQRNRTDADRPGIRKAKELDLNGYIKWNLEMKKFMPMKNFQVIFLSDKPVETKVNDLDYNLALKRMKNCSVLGVVDRFDESLVVAEEVLRPYFPGIDLSYVKQNVSKDRSGNLEEKIEAGKKLVENETMDMLMEENDFDLQLYSKANEELDKRINDIKSFEEKIIEFQKRCKKK